MLHRNWLGKLLLEKGVIGSHSKEDLSQSLQEVLLHKELPGMDQGIMKLLQAQPHGLKYLPLCQEVVLCWAGHIAMNESFLYGKVIGDQENPERGLLGLWLYENRDKAFQDSRLPAHIIS